MAGFYIPPPSLIEQVWDLLTEIARNKRALVTLTIDRGERGHMTMTFDERGLKEAHDDQTTLAAT